MRPIKANCTVVSSCSKYCYRKQGLVLQCIICHFSSGHYVYAVALIPAEGKNRRPRLEESNRCLPWPQRRKHLILAGSCRHSFVPPHLQAVPDLYQHRDTGSLLECMGQTSAGHHAGAAGERNRCFFCDTSSQKQCGKLSVGKYSYFWWYASVEEAYFHPVPSIFLITRT